MRTLSFVRAAFAALIACTLASLAPRRRSRSRSPASSGCTCCIAATSTSTTRRASRRAQAGPGHLTVTCYLIKHAKGWVLFDTGVGDHIVKMPEGQKSGAGKLDRQEDARKPARRARAEAGRHQLCGAVAFARRPRRQSQAVPAVDAGRAEGRVGLEAAGRRAAVSARHEGDHARRRPRPVRRRQRDADRDPRPFARSSEHAGPAAEDRRHHVHRRFRAHQGELGQRPRAQTQFQWPQSLEALERMRAVLKEDKAELWIGHEPSEVPLRKYAPAYYE